MELKPDSTIVRQILHIPDSVYIQRLSALPFDFKMTYNPVVKRYIELYTVKIKEKLQVIIGLSDFYFPIFDEVFTEYHLPKELKYISIIESALNPVASSHAHAVGLWQFMRGTGKENGLTVNKVVDERRAITESTRAAARYLKTLYNTYNDWQLVLAAYDCGPGNVNKAIRRSGGKRDFWEIYRYLPKETRGYVPEYIGAAYAFNYFRDHNIHPVAAAFPTKIDTILIDKNLYFRQISDVLGIDMAILRLLNPQYLKDFIPSNNNKNYSLQLPSEHKLKFMELKDSIFAYRSAYYSNEYKKHISQTYSIIPGSGNKIIHRVQSGESIGVIAGRYKVSLNSIKEWNNLTSNKIRIGQKIIVYLPKNVKNSI
jgi:membrane-bound lytic murein transglycosylase D